MATKLCPYCSEEIQATAVKCKHCGSMLVDDATSRIPLDPATSARAGLTGKYELLEEIGRGGMAVVYKAVQKNLGRIVALKILPQEFTHDREFLERFHREAREASRLSHHNIVTIHDEGCENGIHFIAMEYLDGEDLHSLIRKKGPLPVEDTVAIVAPIGEALDFAHRQGIVHRDVKSANIILTREGRPVLLDFGIAHAASGTKLTKTGIALGTPEYMSPEQADGEEPEPQSDLYSLAVVAFECLTGKVPFQGSNHIAVLHKIIHDSPPPLETLRPDCPAGVYQCINACLNKDPKQRLSSCHAFSVALTSTHCEEAPFRTIPDEPQKNPSPSAPAAEEYEEGKNYLANLNALDGLEFASKRHPVLWAFFSLIIVVVAIIIQAAAISPLFWYPLWSTTRLDKWRLKGKNRKPDSARAGEETVQESHVPTKTEKIHNAHLAKKTTISIWMYVVGTLAVAVGVILIILLTVSRDPDAKAPRLTTKTDSVSYMIAFNVGRNLAKDSIKVNVDALLLGMKNASVDSTSRLMTDAALQATTDQFQTDLQKRRDENAQAEAARNKLAGEAFLADDKTRAGVVTLPSGLQYRVLAEGRGPSPKMHQAVSANYRGRFIDGKEFDASTNHGGPAHFKVNEVIPAWTEALLKMRVGSKWMIWAPAALAYGERGSGTIPPNATLVFEIELLDVK